MSLIFFNPRTILNTLTTIFLFGFFPFYKVNAENYICSYTWKGEGFNYYLFRKGQYFLQDNHLSSSNRLNILDETSKFLILGDYWEYKNYNAFYVIHLDKNSNRFVSTSVVEPNLLPNDAHLPLTRGRCELQ